MTKRLSIAAGLLVFAASAAPALARPRRVVVAPKRVYVRVAPPRSIIEVRGVALSRRHVWAGGYHRWSGTAYAWVPGHWVLAPRPAAVWVPGHWRHASGGWYWVEGHWK
jgi:WXXGXW repeat (2 copies)